MSRVGTVSTTILGWVLLLAGIAAIVLPGPGLLLMLAGLIVLSQNYDWARRRVEPMRRRAFAVARASVDSWPRIGVSLLGCLALVGAGLFWWADPQIPHVWIVGPDLPAGGWATGSGLILSGFVAFALVVYSVVNFRWRKVPPDELS